jgi:hypothetical protein
LSSRDASDAAEEARPLRQERALRPANWQTIRQLFLIPVGLVDINGSTVAKPSVGGASVGGGYFTLALTALCRSSLGGDSPGGGGLIHWQSFYDHLVHETQRIAGSGQTLQKPEAFCLPMSLGRLRLSLIELERPLFWNKVSPKYRVRRPAFIKEVWRAYTVGQVAAYAAELES